MHPELCAGPAACWRRRRRRRPPAWRNPVGLSSGLAARPQGTAGVPFGEPWRKAMDLLWPHQPLPKAQLSDAHTLFLSPESWQGSSAHLGGRPPELGGQERKPINLSGRQCEALPAPSPAASPAPGGRNTEQNGNQQATRLTMEPHGNGTQEPSLSFEPPGLGTSSIYSPKGCHTMATTAGESKTLHFKPRVKARSTCEVL